MKYLILLLIPVLTACAGSGGAAAKAATPIAGVPTTPVPTPTPVPVSAGPVNLTYYTVTHSVNGIPFKGSCVSYNSNGFCWDDGIKQAVPSANHYSFWQVTTAPGHCSGNCTTDLLSSSPTLVDGALLSYMVNSLVSETPSTVLANGVPTNVTCTVNANILNCVDFQIDLNQVPL